MAELHPLTDRVVDLINGEDLDTFTADLDALIRDYVTPPVQTAESGVKFPDMPDTLVTVAGNFIQSGYQMQMAIIGTEPILVVQPEYDADENEVTLITTAVDLPPAGLVHVLEALLDGTREIVRIQEAQAAEQAEADSALRAANDEFEAQAARAIEQ